MSALRPLPSAIFAIAQRLSEATPQRKQLVATICSTHSIVNGRNPHRDLHSRAFTGSRRRFHVLCDGNEQIDLRGYRFEHRLEDIQTLNERAMRGELHISAVSIHAYAYFGDKYLLLPCGASMGDGYGPLVIEKHRTTNSEPPTSNEDFRERLRNRVIAVPGTMTSAFLALQLYLGEFKYIVVPFDQIFETLRSGRAEAGLIIHEGQLTYAQSGFTKIIDLGEWWKERTGLPLPLGGNVLRRDIPREIQHDLAAILRESIQFGLNHRAEAVQHSMPYARDREVTWHQSLSECM